MAGSTASGSADGTKDRTASGAERTSLSAQTREAVRQRIVDRRYALGARLVEREVAEELRMSRVPVREALRSLVAEGLLELLPHSGVRVRRLGRADVRHLYEVWEPLAVQASRLSARRVARSAPEEPPGLAALRATLGHADRAPDADDGAREVAAHTAAASTLLHVRDSQAVALKSLFEESDFEESDEDRDENGRA
ncbi:GntR family transcriptional regulator [Streptomyces sp. NPDC058308]|uniref:GntR family transcriptional regulator n=1 Tax=Streptomyces sp. NPDC058308 TaxID=3346440 RepID=UPI0036EC7756